MHNWQFDTLEEVLRFYREMSSLAAGDNLRNGDAERSRIDIDAADFAALAAFLRSLDEDYRLEGRGSEKSPPTSRADAATGLAIFAPAATGGGWPGFPAARVLRDFATRMTAAPVPPLAAVEVRYLDHDRQLSILRPRRAV